MKKNNGKPRREMSHARAKTPFMEHVSRIPTKGVLERDDFTQEQGGK